MAHNHNRQRINWRGRMVDGATARQRGFAGMAGRRRGYAGSTTGTATPSGMSCPPVPSCPPGNYPNVNDNPSSCQGGMCDDLPPVCGANVLGFNSLQAANLGIAAGGQLTIFVDAGDACRWRPRALFLAAFEADGVTAQRLATPLVQLPFLLLNASVGSIPQIRRQGQIQFGILSDAYSDRKELTAVDWAPFTSVQNQGLSLLVQNIANENIHVFGVIWGDNL